MSEPNRVRQYVEDKKQPLLILAGAATVIAVALVATSGSDPEPQADDRNDVIDTMSVTFVGYPSPEEIEPLLTAAMSATGTADTADNRSRAGSTLIALRKQNGGTEMDMLRCIPTVSGGALPLSPFPSAAAICSLEGL